MVFGYNGLLRFGTGWTKLLGSAYAPEIGWLYPLAVLALIFGLIWRRRAERGDQIRGGFVFWGVWLFTFGLIFSKMSRIPHTAYMASLAPPLAALSAAGSSFNASAGPDTSLGQGPGGGGQAPAGDKPFADFAERYRFRAPDGPKGGAGAAGGSSRGRVGAEGGNAIVTSTNAMTSTENQLYGYHGPSRRCQLPDGGAVLERSDHIMGNELVRDDPGQ
jgi:hypothetical protein